MGPQLLGFSFLQSSSSCSSSSHITCLIRSVTENVEVTNLSFFNNVSDRLITFQKLSD